VSISATLYPILPSPSIPICLFFSCVPSSRFAFQCLYFPCLV